MTAADASQPPGMRLPSGPAGRGPRHRALRSLARNPSAIFGGVIVSAFVVVSIAAPLVAPYAPTASDWGQIRQPPSAAHWMGTDDLGRDILSRLIWGARASLMAGVVSVLIALAIGAPFGMIAGYYRGAADAVISRCTEALLSIPFLITAIALAAFLGPSLQNAMIAIGLAAAPMFCRLMRTQTMAVAAEDYVDNARSVGVRDRRLLLVHILPNAVNPVLVQATLATATAIIAEASLSFLGLGQQPPEPSWGSMLNTARAFMEQAPWMAIWPGMAIYLVVLGFNLLGDGLRDAFDPRQA